MATELVLEPIFEADFSPISYGFSARAPSAGRHRRSAVLHQRPTEYEWVIEGDVENCFGSIHHGLLLAELRRR